MIKTAEYIISSARVEQCPSGNLPEFAFIGRSNVGKSSLINMLTGKSHLAKTSATPGKTVLINHFLVNGQGAKGRGEKNTKAGNNPLAPCSLSLAPKDAWYLQMMNLFLLIDVRHEPQRIDMEFIQWLGENGIPFSIVFTKADKLSKGKLAANVKFYLDELSKEWEELPPYFVTSSETRQGRDELLDYIEILVSGK